MTDARADELCHLTRLPGVTAVALCGASTKCRMIHGNDIAKLGEPWPSGTCTHCGRQRCPECVRKNKAAAR